MCKGADRGKIRESAVLKAWSDSQMLKRHGDMCIRELTSWWTCLSLCLFQGQCCFSLPELEVS